MEFQTISKQLLFSTARIETDKYVGNGFVMQAELNYGGSMTFLITNKQVIANAKKISFFFTKSDIEKTSNKSDQKSDQKIIELISQHPESTIEELMQKLDFSASGIKKILKSLKKSGKLIRVGPDKGGRWKVVG